MKKTAETNIKKTFLHALPQTLPIFAGFLFIGISYGIYMNNEGFSPIYPLIMSATIFAGSMEFVTATLLQSTFNPAYAFSLTLIVNSRHLFYGISMLGKYNNTGIKKIYLIFGMCDETFSLNCSAKIPDDINKSWFYFFITLLNHIYWIIGASLGGILGHFIKFNISGLEFVMNALFLVIFIDIWQKEAVHINALIGLIIPVICLFIFRSDYFLIPSMIGILASLILLKNSITNHLFDFHIKEKENFIS